MASTRRYSRAARVRERGTVLLMVIGVLALMAIIAVVYATLGRAERSSAAALARADRNDEVTRAIAESVAQQVAAATFARYPELVPTHDARQPSAPNEFEVQWRIRAFDYPGIDDKAISVLRRGANLGGQTQRTGEYVFSPTGEIVGLPQSEVTGGGAAYPYPYWYPPAPGSTPPQPISNTNRPREFGAPFLSSEPGFIEQPSWVTGGAVRSGNPTLATNDARPAILNGRNVPNVPYRLIRDWPAISNIAPSGNAVNLVNLRNNFDAESGFGLDQTPLRNPRMSSRLTLYDASDATGTGVLVADASMDADAQIPNMFRWDGKRPRLNRPSDWFTNQVNAYRPMVDLRYRPGDAEYVHNSWADADGDGLADSRWVELVKLSWEQSNPQGYVAEQMLAALSRTRGGNEMRYFIAARIVDNGSKVNVNTATEFYQPPTMEMPPGATPADIDLRRVLMNIDGALNWYAYGGATQTLMENAPYGDGVIPLAQNPLNDYRQYTTNPRQQMDNAGAEVGMSAYSALRAAQAGMLVSSESGQKFSQSEQGNGVFYAPAFGAFERASYYANVARPDQQALRSDAVNGNIYPSVFVGRAGQATFGLADELELRLRNGLNDETNLSRLESVLGGRHPSNALGNLSVLRDDRPLAIERTYRDQPIVEIGMAPNQPGDQALLLSLFDVRQKLTTINGARPLLDTSEQEFATRGMRLRLDATPLLSRLSAGEFVYDLSPLNQRPDANQLLAARVVRYDAIRRLFTGYLDALAPYSDRRAAWEPAPTGANGLPAYTLAYGGSTEIAIRIAAHLAANLADGFDIDRARAFAADAADAPDVALIGAPGAINTRRKEKQIQDDDTVPTAMTLAISRAAAAEMTGVYNSVQSTPEEQDLYPWAGLFPVARSSGVVPAAAELLRLAETGPQTNANGASQVQLQDQMTTGVQAFAGLRDSQPQGAGALGSQSGNGVERVNVYGVEAQPFLIDVAAYSLSADAPEGAGGDEDGEPYASANSGAPPYVTIHRRRDLDNADFIGDILTFTLQNPFDQRVYLYRATLATGTPSQSKPRFYVEFANRFYIFAEATNSTGGPGAIGVDTSKDVVLEAGETKVFYVINPGRMIDLATRISEVREPGNPRSYTVDNLRGWLRQMFGSNTPDEPMVMVDPRTFQAMPFQATTRSNIRTPRVDVQGGNTSSGATSRSEESVEVELFGERSLTGSPFGFSPASGSGLRNLPTTGPSNGPVGYGDTSSAGRSVAMLWRVMREPESTTTVLEGDPTLDYKRQVLFNDIVNDLLADRLRDPTTSGGTTVSIIEELLDDIDDQRDMGGGTDGPAWDAGGPNRDNCQAIQAGSANYGAVTMSFARFARPFDPGLSASGGQAGRGTLPAWCLESKLDRDLTTTPNWNNRSSGGVFGAWSLNWSEHQDEMSSLNITAGTTSRAACNFFNAVANNIDTTANKAAHARLTGPVAPGIPGSTTKYLGPSGRTGEPARLWRDIGPVYASRALIGTGALIDRTVLNPGLYSRSGDFLLPLAVGPEFAPGRQASSNNFFGSAAVEPRLAELETKWLTLGEALALGTGYYSPAAPAVQQPGSVAIHYNYSNDTRGAAAGGNVPIVPIVDRGGLVIDAWAPHLSSLAGSGYTPVGTGVPLALGIFDEFRVAPGVGGLNAGDRLAEVAFGTATSVVPGVMNVNTMSTDMLRVQPLVSPEAWSDGTGAGEARAEAASWMNPGPTVPNAATGRCCFVTNWPAPGNTGTYALCIITTAGDCAARGIPNTNFQANQVCDAGDMCGSLPPNADAGRPSFPEPMNAYTTVQPSYPRPAAKLRGFESGSGFWNGASSLHGPNSPVARWDVAPTIAAYRDRKGQLARGVIDVGGGVFPNVFSHFFDQSQDDANARFEAIDNGSGVFARSMGIGGAREARGFKSLGELMMANQYNLFRRGGVETILPEAPGGVPAAGPISVLRPSITRFGAADEGVAPSSEVTSLATLVRDQNTGRATTQRTVIRTASSLANKIAIANAMSGTTSVRSDIFTAYLLVHGYTRQDVEGLDDDQPMVPSVAKRFVMVVDRSNVTQRGDKPKVLMLKEVSLD